MTILVTGATGLIGSHLVRHLLSQGKQVRAICRPTTKFDLIADVKNRIEWLPANLADPQALYQAMQGVQQLYHCAALISYHPAEAAHMRHTNRQGTANVVNMALEAGVGKMLHVSSIAALGRHPNKTIDENTPWHDSPYNSQYAISKMLADREVWRGIAEGLSALIVHPSVVLGAGNWQQGSCRLISRVADGLRFYTNGSTGFVDVADVVQPMQQLMDSPIANERFILSAENWTYRQFFTTVAQQLQQTPPRYPANRWMSSIAWRAEALQYYLTGKPPLITRETARTARQKSSYNNQKICTTLGYQFKPLHETIEKVCKAFLEK